MAGTAADLATALFRRVRRSGQLRDDVAQTDIVLLLEIVAQAELPGNGPALRRRYLALLLEALHAPAAARLPGRPPSQADLVARWRTRSPAAG